MSNLGSIIGFKKSEILNIIKEFDPNFSFNSKPIDQTPLDGKDLQTQIHQLQQRVAELETQNKLKDDRIAELEQQLANAPNQATRSQKDEHISELESQTSENRLMLKGLALHNHNIAKAKAFAQIIAKSIWDMDENQQIKTGDMVQYIKGLLLKFDQKNLPQNDETLADWLKDVKPTYATKGGRPPKDAPNEITLTFKK